MARKAKGSSNWFVGAISDEQARVTGGSLSFLEKGKKYVATVYRDADNAHWEKNPQAYTIEKFIVDSNTNLKLKLAEGGGTAISIIPASASDLKTIKAYKK